MKLVCSDHCCAALLVDYGLAPETQYPTSLTQIMTVYKWMLNGGLGFKPDRIALFGESAGNAVPPSLVLSLCLLV